MNHVYSSSSGDSPRRVHTALILVILLGLALRLFLAHTIEGSFDVYRWEDVANKLIERENIFLQTYETDGNPWSANSPPPWYVLAWMLKLISNISGVSFYFLIKLPMILADVIIILLLFLIGRRLGWKARHSLGASLLFAVHPISILISSAHGQFDSIATLFVVLAIYAFLSVKLTPFGWLQRNELFCALFIGIGILIKLFPLFLLPFFFFKMNGIKKRIAFVFWALVPLGIGVGSLLFVSLDSFINEFSLLFGYPSLYAVWGYPLLLNFMNYLFRVPGYEFLDAFFRITGTPVLGVALLIMGFLARKLEISKGIVIMFLVFYTFTPGFGGQYLTWILPFLILTVHKKGFKEFFIFSVFGMFVVILGNLHPYGGAFKFISLPVDESMRKLGSLGAALATWGWVVFWFAKEGYLEAELSSGVPPVSSLEQKNYK